MQDCKQKTFYFFIGNDTDVGTQRAWLYRRDCNLCQLPILLPYFFSVNNRFFSVKRRKKRTQPKTPAEKLNCSHGNFKLSPRLHRRLYAALSRFHAASYFFCALPASVHKIRTALESRPCQECGIPAGNRTQISSLGNCCSIHWTTGTAGRLIGFLECKISDYLENEPCFPHFIIKFATRFWKHLLFTQH